MNTDVAEQKTDVSTYDEPEESAGQFRIPELRASGGMSETDIEQGHLYLRDFNVPQDEDPIDIDLEDGVELIILRDAKRLQHYDSDENRTMIDSTEFRSWDEQIVLFRYVTDDEGHYQPRIVSVLPYTSKVNGECMKTFKEDHFPNQVKMKYVAYALMKDEEQESGWRIIKINMSNADLVGMDTEMKPKFESPDADSFEVCKREVYKDASKKQMFNHRVKIGTHKVTNKVMRKTFAVIDRLEEDNREMVTMALHELYEMLKIQIAKKIERAVQHTDLKKVVSLNSKYIEDIQTDQKPLLSIARYEKHKVLMPGESAPVPRNLMSGPTKGGGPEQEESVSDVVDALEGKGEEKKEEGKDEGDGAGEGEGKEPAKSSGKTKADEKGDASKKG